MGLPNVGKSTLFNAITNAGAECANYPFCTIEPNVGMVAVPDAPPGLARAICTIPKRPPPPSLSSWTSPVWSRAPAKGEGLGNKFLSNIRGTGRHRSCGALL